MARARRITSLAELREDLGPPPEQLSPPTSPPPEPGVPPEGGGRRAFSAITRAVTPEELKEPGTQKLVLELLQDAESDAEERKTELAQAKIEIKALDDAFHRAEMQSKILEEKLTKNTAYETLATACFTLAGVLVGYSQATIDAKSQMILLACGIGLFVASVVVKVGSAYGSKVLRK